MVSSTSVRSCRGNGGGSEADSTSTSQSASSISPVASRSLAVPSGRGLTVPVTRTTYSPRRSRAPSTTHWTTPVRSRRSTKAKCSLCSRRRSTQPHTVTVRPSSASRSSPHRSVRMAVASPITGPPPVRTRRR